MLLMLRDQKPVFLNLCCVGWGWVGLGGAITFTSTCTHTTCYVTCLALAHT